MLILICLLLSVEALGSCGPIPRFGSEAGPRQGFSLREESATENLYSSDSRYEGSVSDSYKRLKSLPDVKSLKLHIGGQGDSNFNFEEGDRFPALEELYIAGDYDFDDYLPRRWKRLAIKDWESRSCLDKLKYSGPLMMIEQYIRVRKYRSEEHPKLSNLDRWIAAMDWSQLTLLELWSLTPGFLQKMGPHLTSLKTLHFNHGGPRFWGKEDIGFSECDQYMLVNHFFSQLLVNSLTDIKLFGCWNSATIEQILKRGASLKQLELRKNRSVHSLSVSELERIGLLCPHLESMSIELNRNISSWPWDKLEALRGFKSLARIDIFFERIPELMRTGDLFEDFPPEETHESMTAGETTALVRHRAAVEIFKFVRDGNKGAPLRIATFYGSRGSLTCSPFEESGEYKPEGIGWCEGLEEDTYADDFRDLWL